ncbi:hypothetical protein JCM31826_22200 [Thermaurantimonas aggregans]|uniref:Uncharacterized protein n=1 Tax=Thermaurantimonas aggregans TaxID=2173829 RepID=A0A401XNY7_9FLAO|nr:hypothetical protein [Thermaurantimonas aggregans]MCX8148620.1 hypothetical protein [Thermaurantimonas aggregans]GCD78738.1 hypothetical protein JCM31826_22200 [Thermaurantimonas aggregans]
MKSNTLLSIVYFFFLIHLKAQQTDYQWWNTLHGWDGMSPFESYLHLEPGRMGPNALPVPELMYSVWDSLNGLSGTTYYTTTRGEKTYSLKNSIYYQADRRVALCAWMVSAEYFTSSDAVRDFRAARTYEGRGWAIGDLYVETHWQIVQFAKKLPQIALRIGLKTASGSRVEDARFTDTPGYYFDVNFRKIYSKQTFTYQFFGMLGFFAYQTYRTDHKQNDALLFGIGGRLQSRKWGAGTHLRSYLGYFGKYDKPVIGSLEVFYFLNKDILKFRIEKGNVSWPFTGLRLEYYYRF